MKKETEAMLVVGDDFNYIISQITMSKNVQCSSKGFLIIAMMEHMKLYYPSELQLMGDIDCKILVG